MVLLEEFSLVLRFSKNFLADWRMFSGLLKCFVFFFYLDILFSKCFAESFGIFFIRSFCLILAPIFPPFDCLRFPWHKFFCKSSIIGSNGDLKFPCKVLSLYFSQEINILMQDAAFKKRWNMFFRAGFCIFQLVTYF